MQVELQEIAAPSLVPSDDSGDDISKLFGRDVGIYGNCAIRRRFRRSCDHDRLLARNAIGDGGIILPADKAGLVRRR